MIKGHYHSRCSPIAPLRSFGVLFAFVPEMVASGQIEHNGDQHAGRVHYAVIQVSAFFYILLVVSFQTVNLPIVPRVREPSNFLHFTKLNSTKWKFY